MALTKGEDKLQLLDKLKEMKEIKKRRQDMQ